MATIQYTVDRLEVLKGLLNCIILLDFNREYSLHVSMAIHFSTTREMLPVLYYCSLDHSFTSVHSSVSSLLVV